MLLESRSGDHRYEHLKYMGNKQDFGKKKDAVSHFRASFTALSWSYISLACLLALVVICRKVIYQYQFFFFIRGIYNLHEYAFAILGLTYT